MLYGYMEPLGARLSDSGVACERAAVLWHRGVGTEGQNLLHHVPAWICIRLLVIVSYRTRKHQVEQVEPRRSSSQLPPATGASMVGHAARNSSGHDAHN